jgi:hypothetical protein
VEPGPGTCRCGFAVDIVDRGGGLLPIFGPRANLFTNAALIAAAGGFLFLLLLIWVMPVMGYNTQAGLIPPQPVPFSHKHHVGDDGIDCRCCHTTVEISQNAGMPRPRSA